MKWVGPSTSMASCPSGHVTSASTDRLPSPTNAGACSPVVGGQGRLQLSAITAATLPQNKMWRPASCQQACTGRLMATLQTIQTSCECYTFEQEVSHERTI
jgi:hypothetical protein